MKYLGIDFGSKKVGFAQSDDEGRMAYPLMIAPNDAILLKDTLELIREMKFSVVVIGESVDDLDGQLPDYPSARGTAGGSPRPIAAFSTAGATPPATMVSRARRSMVRRKLAPRGP